MENAEIKYYSRQLLLSDLGKESQQKLKEAKVLVIGAGGLGCPVLQYLACAGVGKLGIVDGDRVDISNLHRQILFCVGDVGSSKAGAAAKRLVNVNPFIEVVPHSVFLNVENAPLLIKDYDLVVDCSDNYGTRFLINDVCVQLGKSVVSGSIYRFEGQVSVFNYNNGPTYRCLFPDLPSVESSTNCSEAGVIGVLPGMIGLFQATEVIKIITGSGEILSGKILVVKAMNNSFISYDLSRNDIIYQNTLNKNLNSEDYDLSCLNESETIVHVDNDAIEKLYSESNLVLLDVREMNELPRIFGDNVMVMPLSILEKNIDKLPKERNFLVGCKSGIRSEKAIRILQKNSSLKSLYNLKNGINDEVIEIWKKVTKN